MVENPTECPPECQKDRLALHAKADDRIPLGMFKWIMGLLIAVVIGIFGILWQGQVNNAERITVLHSRLSTEISALRSEFSKSMDDITRIVIRIDERTKLQMDHEKEMAKKHSLKDE